MEERLKELGYVKPDGISVEQFCLQKMHKSIKEEISYINSLQNDLEK